jgi:hypothetical protein
MCTGVTWPCGAEVSAPWVSATGHRELAEGDRVWARSELARVAAKLRDGWDCNTGISGMARTVDQDWAAVVVDAGLRLCAMIPFPGQADRWPSPDQARWRELLRLADRVVPVSGDDPVGGRAATGMLHARNDTMLENSDAVVAVADPRRLSFRRHRVVGGTWSAVDKAVRRGLPVIWVNPAGRTVTVPSVSRWAEIMSTPEKGNDHG